MQNKINIKQLLLNNNFVEDELCTFGSGYLYKINDSSYVVAEFALNIICLYLSNDEYIKMTLPLDTFNDSIQDGVDAFIKLCITHMNRLQ